LVSYPLNLILDQVSENVQLNQILNLSSNE